MKNNYIEEYVVYTRNYSQLKRMANQKELFPSLETPTHGYESYCQDLFPIEQDSARDNERY